MSMGQFRADGSVLVPSRVDRLSQHVYGTIPFWPIGVGSVTASGEVCHHSCGIRFRYDQSVGCFRDSERTS